DKEVLEEFVITKGAAIIKPSENSEEEQLCGQLPFLLPPASAPCRINCENYDRGGEGISYHKLTDTKSEIYRMDNVIIELCDDIGVGYNVKNMVGGEWLEYTINVRKACEYVFRLRVRGSAGISVDIDSQNSTEIIETQGDNWQTVSSAPITLGEGEQVIRLLVRSGKLSANWIEIEEA
ncbi:MAG: carbohydrate-binding protein, partial [Oscillospiraceae bacterium]|nr:carbohydrate-binding protein [Oscillospiraceae bacterium]